MAIRSLLFHSSIALLFCVSSEAFAGPPFRTDDPQPVDYMHWEFYIASMQQVDRQTTFATLPHFEINYGIVPDVQLHLVAPLGYVHVSDVTHYGYSDTELGVKYRFVKETETVPQVGIFPLIELPTGNEKDQLGAGAAQVYIPIWIQKSWGNWTTYGGGGFWYNPASGQQNWIFTGWELQYDFSNVITLGGEICYQTASETDSPESVSFNIGGYINLDESNHILFSFGHNLSGYAMTTGYIGYQLTM